MITSISQRRKKKNEEFGELFRTTYPRLYRLAYSLLNDQEDSRDVVNDVFAYLLDKHKPTVDINEGYLLTMVRNRAIDLLRRRRVEDEVRADIISDYKPYVMSESTSSERLKEIQQFIETELTPQTRKVLQLCYDEKKTYQTAASELGVSVQAVNKHISGALRKLREHFNPASVQTTKSSKQ